MTTLILGPGADAVRPFVDPSVFVIQAAAGASPLEAWVPRVAAAVHAAAIRGEAGPPYFVCVSAGAAADLPALSFALRAGRRPLSAYVLLEPELPPGRSDADWPDAPVTVVTTRDDVVRAAGLRGWRVVRGSWSESANRALPPEVLLGDE